MRFLALLAVSSCASLNTGWARVTYVEGRVAPVMTCAFRIDKEGDVEAICAATQTPKPARTDL